jgi:hypothetical protein
MVLRLVSVTPSRRCRSNVLEGSGKRILFGERIAALSILRPYGGWAKTLPLIRTLITELHNTGIVAKVERFSLRYANVIGPECGPDLTPFDLELRFAKFPLRSNGLQIHVEIELNECITIVQLLPGARISLQRSPKPEILEGIMRYSALLNGWLYLKWILIANRRPRSTKTVGRNTFDCRWLPLISARFSRIFGGFCRRIFRPKTSNSFSRSYGGSARTGKVSTIIGPIPIRERFCREMCGGRLSSGISMTARQRTFLG